MRAINAAAAAILKRILLIGNDEACFKIDNTKGLFMPVVVEHLGDIHIKGFGQASQYSIAHYFEQNGDLMADPEMCFLAQNGIFYPYYFKQDGGIPVEQISMMFENGIHGNWKLQKDHTEFMQFWLNNIKEQQKL